MKNKVIGIILTVIMVLSFVFVLPVSANALPSSYQDIGVTMANRLLETQNIDGGWEWENPDTDNTTGTPSPSNTLGVTALGLLDMYKLTGNVDYLNACIRTYDAIVLNSSNPNPAIHKIRGTDLTFLAKLSQVTGDSTYADFANTRWASAKLEFGGDTATGFAEYVRDARVAQGYSSIVTWDINLYVQGLEALGNTAEALEMSEVSYVFLYGSSPYVVNSATDGRLDYTGAIESFAVTQTHVTEMNTLVADLIASQNSTDGSFDYAGIADPQTTAYAVTALLKANEYDSALAGVDYLKSVVLSNGSILETPSDSASPENTEVISEAVQAIYALIMATPLNINATAGTNGTIAPIGDITVSHSESQSFTITPDANYHIVDVLVDGVSVGAVSSYTFNDISTDHTISCSFSIDTFTLRINVNGSGTVTLNSSLSSYEYGTSVTLQAVPSNEFTFSGWSGDLSGNSNPVSIVMDSDKNITASFEQIIVGGGGGGGGSSAPLPNLSGINHSDDGVVYEDVEVISVDNNVNYEITEGTKALDKNGNPLYITRVDPVYDVPELPQGENIVGIPYEFQPNGATFNPAITITFKYDPSKVSSDSELKLVFWNGSEWVALTDVTINSDGTVSGKTTHFTKFALISVPKPVITTTPTSTTPVVTTTTSTTQTTTTTSTTVTTTTITSTPTQTIEPTKTTETTTLTSTTTNIPTQTYTPAISTPNTGTAKWVLIGAIVLLIILGLVIIFSRRKK